MIKNEKTTIVHRLLTFCVLALFLACQTNDTDLIENSSEQTELLVEGPFQITTIGTEEIPRVTKFLNYRAQKDIFAKDKDAGAIFDHENVKKAIDTLGQESYSFRFTYPDRPDNVFYNLIVGVNPDGTSKEPYVVKYVCDEDQFATFEEYNYNFLYFKGTINLHSFNDFFQDSDFTKDCTGSNGDPVECAQTIFIGSSTSPTNVSGQGYEGGGVTYTPNGLGGYDVTVSIFHTIPSGQTYQYTSGSTCQHPGECDVDVYISGSKKQQKRTSSDCADCSLPTVIEGIANLGVSIGLNTSQITWLKKTENHNLAGQIKYYFSYVSTNSTLAREQIKDIVNAGMNRSLISAFPFIKYPDAKAKEYQNNYPRLTEYLKNQLPRAAGISKIVDALHEFTQLPKDRIKKELQWDEGPEINIIQLDDYKPGETDADSAGFFDESTPNVLYLDIDFVNLVETETSDPDAMIFWIGTTVLHEYVHYGDSSTGFDYGIGDDGRKWEINVYGTDVMPDTARLILNRLN